MWTSSTFRFVWFPFPRHMPPLTLLSTEDFVITLQMTSLLTRYYWVPRHCSKKPLTAFLLNSWTVPRIFNGSRGQGSVVANAEAEGYRWEGSYGYSHLFGSYQHPLLGLDHNIRAR